MVETLQKLDQTKLNVADKSRSNLFSWRGQFTPQLVDYLIETFGQTGGTVLDPFSGSGTVLVEAARHGMGCYGNELNPAAYAMSKFFHLANESTAGRNTLMQQLSQLIEELVGRYDDLPLLSSGDAHREKFTNLLEFGRILLAATSGREMLTVCALNLLFRAESMRKDSLHRGVRRAFQYLHQIADELPTLDTPIDAFLGDARDIDARLPSTVNLVITSPPYINVFNYHQNYRAILELLDWDLLSVAKSEIGSNRKNRGNRFRAFSLSIAASIFSSKPSYFFSSDIVSDVVDPDANG